MSEKEILTLAVLGVKAKIVQKCIQIADRKGFSSATLDTMRSLIEELDELGERLTNYCDE